MPKSAKEKNEAAVSDPISERSVICLIFQDNVWYTMYNVKEIDTVLILG